VFEQSNLYPRVAEVFEQSNLDIPKYRGASMLSFKYQEHFSGSDNLLQASSVAVVHRTSRNMVPYNCKCLTQVVHPILRNIVSWA
jgi:hypothetical protein